MTHWLRGVPALGFLLALLSTTLLGNWGWLMLPALPLLAGRNQSHLVVLLLAMGLGNVNHHRQWTKEKVWETMGKGFIEVEGRWLQDVYARPEPPYQGKARLTPLQAPEHAIDLWVRLESGDATHELEELVLGARWKGRVASLGGVDRFVDVSWNGSAGISTFYQLRASWIRAFESHWSTDSPALPLLRSLITGDRSGLEREQRMPFERLGLLALLAISGLHLGLIYVFILKLVPWRGGLWALVGCFIYATLGGWSLALTRAFGMCLIAALALPMGRRYRSINALAFMASVELCLDPSLIEAPGFLLTYLGVLGILWAGFPPGRPWWKTPVVWYRSSWGAMLWTWPVTLVTFNSVPGWAWLWGPIFFASFPLVMIWVFIVGFLSFLFPMSEHWLLPLEHYLQLLHGISSLGSWVEWRIPTSPRWLLCYYFGMLLMALAKPIKNRGHSIAQERFS